MAKGEMSKAKKDFIAAIITLVTGVLLLTTGIIMATIIAKKIVWIFGIVIIVCAVAVLALAIYETIKKHKLVKKESK